MLQYRKKMIKLPLLLIITISSFALGCTGGLIRPPMGITKQFLNTTDGEPVDIISYDFSRLNEGYALFVFSFDFRGNQGNGIIGFKDQYETGLRVWEHKLDSSDWDVKLGGREFMYWGFRSIRLLCLAREGYKIPICYEIHKGRIVYGGRMVFDILSGRMPYLEYDIDIDFTRLLRQIQAQNIDVEIDTVYMAAPRVCPSF